MRTTAQEKKLRYAHRKFILTSVQCQNCAILSSCNSLLSYAHE
ncbi:hypothetical protein X975_03366, partial [Stegodyphus mimosarum]